MHSGEDKAKGTKKVQKTLNHIINKVNSYFNFSNLTRRTIGILAALVTIITPVIMVLQCGYQNPSSVSISNRQNDNDLVSIEFNILFNGLEDVITRDPVKTPSPSIKVAQETAFLYFDQENYNGALEYLEKTYEEQSKTYGVDDFSTVSAKYLIGLAYYKMFEFEQSINNLNVALSSISDKTEKKDELLAEIYYVLGLSFYKSDSFENAGIYFRKALDERRAFCENSDSEQYKILDMLAFTQIRLGDNEQALETISEAKQIANTLPENDIILAGLNTLEGRANYSRGNFGTAIANYENALQTFEKNPEEYEHSISSIYNNLGSVYMILREYNTALFNYKIALNIAEKLNGDYLFDRLIVYNNIGVAYTDLDNYDLARLYYDKAISITRSKLGEHNLILAALYCNYALIYKSQGEYDKALKYIQADIRICEELRGEFNLDVAESYGSLADLYSRTQKPSLALFYYEKSLEIKITYLGEDHVQTCWDYYYIANIYHNYYGGDSFEVLEYLRRAYREKAINESPELEKEVHVRALETYQGLGLDIDKFECWLRSDW